MEDFSTILNNPNTQTSEIDRLRTIYHQFCKEEPRSPEKKEKRRQIQVEQTPMRKEGIEANNLTQDTVLKIAETVPGIDLEYLCKLGKAIQNYEISLESLRKCSPYVDWKNLLSSLIFKRNAPLKTIM